MKHRYPALALLNRGLPAVAALALALTACTTETEPGPEAGTDYYPLEVGTYRTFDVADSTWNSNVVRVVRYQFRERVADTFADATGQPAYRLVRSRRTSAAEAWQDDSVMVINATDKTLLLSRNNRRTVELVFPVQANRVWNLNAYNSADTISAENRRYEAVGEPFTARFGPTATTYNQTVTTTYTSQDDLFYLGTYRQVFAKGLGPVYRVRRRYDYCRAGDASCIPSPAYIFLGSVRVESLIDSGRM